MYGHQFFQLSFSTRVEYLNEELRTGRFESLDELAEDIFVDIQDLKEELMRGGYFFVPDINQFVHIKMGQAG